MMIKESKDQIAVKKKRFEDFVLSTCKKLGIDEQVGDNISLFDSAVSLNENKDHFIRHLKDLGYPIKEREYSKEELEALRIKQEQEIIEKVREKEKEEIEKIKNNKDTKIIDKIFWELHNKFEAFLKSERRLMIVVGGPGIGKTFTVYMKALKSCENVEINRGVCTPAELNDFLGSYCDDYLIIMDDTEGWIEDKKAVSIIKAGSEIPYTVKWGSKGSRVEHKHWQNNSKWLLILNTKPTINMWKPLLSRSYLVEINLKYFEKIKLIYEMAKIKNIPDIIPNFIEESTNPATDRLDIRTLEKGYEFYKTHVRSWKRLLLTELARNPRKEFILSMQEEGLETKEMIKRFSEEGYGSRATFFRLKSQNLM